MSKITWLDWSKTAKQFSVNSSGKFLCLCQASQASKHLVSSFPFSDFQILSSLLCCYFSEISRTFYFEQMFNGFLGSNFGFYCSLALQFSCITVRISEGRFLFAVSD